jgi:hypothetical protein
MTDQELAQAVAERLWQHEAAAAASGDKRKARALKRAHVWLDKAYLAVQPAMELQPLSGGLEKPPQAP